MRAPKPLTLYEAENKLIITSKPAITQDCDTAFHAEEYESKLQEMLIQENIYNYLTSLISGLLVRFLTKNERDVSVLIYSFVL